MIEKIVDFRSKDLIYTHYIHKELSIGNFNVEAHNYYELIYIVSGDVSYVIEDRRYKLKKGDLIITRPANYHYINIDSGVDYERYDLFFDERALGIHNTSLIPQDTEVVNLRANKIASELFGKLDYYSFKLSKEDFISVASLIITELFYNLSISGTKKNGADYSNASPLVSKAIAYINEHLFEIRDIKEISRELYVTDSYLFRIFKKEMLQSPKRYINDKRILAAQSMISMGERPTDVCERCGFGDYTSFYRSYISFFGYSPSKEHVFNR
ncbi:MAG: helix-turn-helix transcriptional regulator [Clostridia bacterium]|nr:helix-turn-helix transcriptional regulator [Clostridia bacterium]